MITLHHSLTSGWETKLENWWWWGGLWSYLCQDCPVFTFWSLINPEERFGLLVVLVTKLFCLSRHVSLDFAKTTSALLQQTQI